MHPTRTEVPAWKIALAGVLAGAAMVAPGTILAQSGDSPERICRDNARMERRAADADTEAAYLEGYAQAQRQYAAELRSLIGIQDLDERQDRYRDAKDRLRDRKRELRDIRREQRRENRDRYEAEIDRCRSLDDDDNSSSSRSSSSRSSSFRFSSSSFSYNSSIILYEQTNTGFRQPDPQSCTGFCSTTQCPSGCGMTGGGFCGCL